jgi:hypothetical protein
MEKQRTEDAPHEVPLADAPVATLFFALDTQWRRHAMSGLRIGIDYAAIRPTAELYQVELSPELMADIRMMEAAALAQFAEDEKRRARR